MPVPEHSLHGMCRCPLHNQHGPFCMNKYLVFTKPLFCRIPSSALNISSALSVALNPVPLHWWHVSDPTPEQQEHIDDSGNMGHSPRAAFLFLMRKVSCSEERLWISSWVTKSVSLWVDGDAAVKVSGERA